MNANLARGFSLIELMIAVVIVGIITAIAYPSYQGFVQSSIRSSAQADLMALAAAMERHRIANNSYQGAATSGGDTGAPAIYTSYSPSDDSYADRRYDLKIETVAANGNSYTLIAAAVSETSAADDGDLFLFSDGRKAWDQDNNGTIADSEYCWSC